MNSSGHGAAVVAVHNFARSLPMLHGERGRGVVNWGCDGGCTTLHACWSPLPMRHSEVARGGGRLSTGLGMSGAGGSARLCTPAGYPCRCFSVRRGGRAVNWDGHGRC